MISKRFGVISKRCGVISRTLARIRSLGGAISERCGMISERRDVITERCDVISERYSMIRETLRHAIRSRWPAILKQALRSRLEHVRCTVCVCVRILCARRVATGNWPRR